MTKVKIHIKQSDFACAEHYELYKKISRETIKTTALPLRVTPQKVFHYTKINNIDSIKANGLTEGVDGGIFLSSSYKSNLEHLTNKHIAASFLVDLYGNYSKNTDLLSDYVILEGEPIDSNLCDWYAFENSLFYMNKTLKLNNLKIHYLQ